MSLTKGSTDMDTPESFLSRTTIYSRGYQDGREAALAEIERTVWMAIGVGGVVFGFLGFLIGLAVAS